MISTINPATGKQLQTFDTHSYFQIDGILTAAVDAQKAWRLVSVEDRVQILRNTAKILRENVNEYAHLITLEMGKPISEARAEIEKSAVAADFYAQNAVRFLDFESIDADVKESGVVYEPLGVVLAIMPWNYPFWQFFRFALPALVAGNGAILKHANNVPRSALAVQDILDKAGLAPGLCATVLIEPEKVAAIIADDRIAAVALTGSTQVGAIVASQAGAALKKQVLELGGSDPFIVLSDADIKDAARTAVRARFTNAGQACINAKRFIVDEEIADEFVAEFVIQTRELILGDPFDPATDMGPMARENLRATLHDQVQRTLEAGGRLLLGGELPEGLGYFYPPTIIDRVVPGHAAFDEETFGPVAAITRVSSTEEAIALANQTEFGLAASLWTRDTDRAKAVVRRLDAGAVFVNGMVVSDPRLPFGGIKKSGYGRELGRQGIREFTNMKTVWIGPDTTGTKGKTWAQ
ncbi:succinate-semialdehyde dehydrogenase [Arthrobacter sp. StoSoilA2]|uniref:NAD-dependent succinate-semialdehyde dehydrogenase n=1 Tax=unclassified Arthrobacter TaxID=235627 RepID=UPI001CC5C799|nr:MULTISPECIES: NAD-dependent succinate-semialdehyde dehydrogenase [unclassified Arthrobacter]BCW38379.1 succinate-semialdehyde dehydrogenase [Arthrobacter sp. StoSoilA2]BCW50353.1 succinate-semialdehyde dehydrogenase [Arthrobacter sp. StoSoilB13]